MTVAIHMPRTKLATAARRIAVFSAVLILVALVLHRFGRIETPLGIGLVLTGFAGAGLALLCGIAAGVVIWRTGVAGAWSAAAGVAISLAIFAWPASVAPFYLKLPPINDVTTDTEHPPEFAALAHDRAKAANPVEYRGGAFPEMQEHFYPEIRPLVLDRAAEEVFEAVGEAVRRLKWRVIAEEPPQDDGTAGHIEAEDRTLILGFIDDVVVRVESDGGATRVDVRSLSRYGIHDFGRNAHRVKEFYAELRARLDATVPTAALRGKARGRGTKLPTRAKKDARDRGPALRNGAAPAQPDARRAPQPRATRP